MTKVKKVKFGVDLREFIKRFRATALPGRKLGPSGREKSDPIMYLEFESSAPGVFQSRIAIFELPNDRMIKYRYAGRSGHEISSWPLENYDYEILRLIPPSEELSFPIIQVGKPNG